MSGALIPTFVALPLAVAFLLPMLPRRSEWASDLLGNAAMAVLVAMCVPALGTSGLYHMGGWATPIGIDLRLDALAALMLLLVNGIGLAATVYSVPYMRRYGAKHRYYALFLLMVAGMNGLVLSGDLFNLFVFMEIAAIASYALVAFGGGHEEVEAAFKYTVLGSVASTLVLVAVAILYGVTGTLNMAHVASRLAADGVGRPGLFALGLFTAGFGLKAALVPFHAWLPDAHPSAPAPISAMLSGVVIKTLGVYALARVVFNVYGATPEILLALRALGLLSMVVGVLLAIGQWDMKRLFAYHSVSQIGYVILGLGLGTPLGIAGGLFHLFNHSIFKSLLFMNSGSVVHATGVRDLKRLGGLAGPMPVTTATSVVASLSIAGVPPLNGFWSKLILVIACVQAGFWDLAAWAIVVSVITLASFLKVERYGFFETMKTALAAARPEPAMMRVAMVLLAAACGASALLVAGGLDSPFLVRPAALVLLAGPFAP
jgi:multicomponent Na+:H+ antiporter subunit D